MQTRLIRLASEPFGAEREWMVEGIPILRAEITLPQVDANGRFNRFYRLQARSYLRYCENMLLPLAASELRSALETSAPLPSITAYLDFQITCQDDRFLSLYTQSRESGLPGPSLLTRRGDTWDRTADTMVPLEDFFPRRERKQLLAAASAAIQRQEAAGLARYREDWRRQLRRCFNPRNYYLTERALTIFYPMYALGPAAEGIPTFTVPRQA